MIEPWIEPPDRKDQARINYLHDMQDAEFEIGAFLEEYKHLFPNEIRSFLVDIRMAVSDMEADDGELF